MSPLIYLLLFVALVIIIIVLILIARYKKNSHTELYKEGVRNENDGQYVLALQNYEDALSEIRKLKGDNKFRDKISDRIKMLRTLIDYESQTGRPISSLK